MVEKLSLRVFKADVYLRLKLKIMSRDVTTSTVLEELRLV